MFHTLVCPEVLAPCVSGPQGWPPPAPTSPTEVQPPPSPLHKQTHTHSRHYQNNCGVQIALACVTVLLYHQQKSVATAVGELQFLLLHPTPSVFALLLLLLVLFLLLLPLIVLGRLLAGQRPPAFHLLGTKDGESRHGSILGQINFAQT